MVLSMILMNIYAYEAPNDTLGMSPF